MTAKPTLYDLLRLTPAASAGDIQAAHLMLVRYYQSGGHGLSQADADNRIKAVKEAWWVLSDPGRRAAYDVSLASARAEAPPAPAAVPLPVEVEIRALKQRSPLRIMLTIIGGLMIVGMLIQIFFSVFAFRQVSRVNSGEVVSEAQQRVIAAERRQTYGDLSDAEIAEQEEAARKQREEAYQAEIERRQEYARREDARRHEQALAERQYYADRVSAELRHAEEVARQKAERERQQKEERERRAEEEEERRLQERLARERARWQRVQGE